MSKEYENFVIALENAITLLKEQQKLGYDILVERRKGEIRGIIIAGNYVLDTSEAYCLKKFAEPYT